MIVGLEDSLTDERLGNIIKLYGFNKEDLKKRFSYENFLFEVHTGQEQFFMRISHSKFRSSNQVKAELDWILYLKENGVSVASPIPSLSGKLIEVVQNTDSYFTIVVFEMVTGENFTENTDLLTPENIKSWGKLLAQLHHLSERYEPKTSSISRLHWDQEPLISNIDETLDHFPVILKNAKNIIGEIQSLPKEPSEYGIIHQDLHEANLIINNGEMTIVDFDDCHYSWYIEDIAIILFHYAWRFQSVDKSRQELVNQFYPVFIQGYQSERKLNDFWIKQIPIFVKLRHYRLFCTLAYELKIRDDEWSQNMLNHWKPMLQRDEKWFELHQFII